MPKPNSQLPPILVADLFPEISSHLLRLLRSLTLTEWALPTSSSKRTVKDIASHLLDGSLRRLSIHRDGYVPLDSSSRQHADESLMDFLNRLNTEWEVGTRRLSPPVIIALMERADLELADFFHALDPNGPAIFPVAWVGEQQSQNWMDVARDYTEKWHHTQQIFVATNRPSTIVTSRLFYPCLDTFMRALPFTFRDVAAPTGSIVRVVITGEAGGDWFVERRADLWIQILATERPPVSTVTMDQVTAWALVTKRRTREMVRREFDIRIDGDVQLGEYVLDMVSMMV